MGFSLRSFSKYGEEIGVVICGFPKGAVHTSQVPLQREAVCTFNEAYSQACKLFILLWDVAFIKSIFF